MGIVPRAAAKLSPAAAIFLCFETINLFNRLVMVAGKGQKAASARKIAALLRYCLLATKQQQYRIKLGREKQRF